MNRSVCKFTASLLIFSLFLPPGIATAVVDLGGDITVNYSTFPDSTYRDETAVKADGVIAPINNFNSIGATQTQTVRVGGNWVTTSDTASILVDGDKKEGQVLFQAARYGESSPIIAINHDLTPPKCAPAPTKNQYKNGTDYYTTNNLRNPWPIGLDGQWTNQIIEFYENDALLCRDRIGRTWGPGNSLTKVQRNAAVDGGAINKCIDSSGLSLFFYDEDKADCTLVKNGQTLNINTAKTMHNMAGCTGSAGSVAFNRHDVERPFYMADKAGNTTVAECPTPFSMYDDRPSVINSLKVEHVGLELPKESLGSNQANANNFRADDGTLILYADFEESSAGGTSGKSGINWEALVETSDQRNIEQQIALEESTQSSTQNSLNGSEADTIILRANIMNDYISLLNELALNNIWNKASTDLSSFSKNTGANTLNGLKTQVNNAAFASFSDSTFDQVIQLLGRGKFDGVSNRDELITSLSNTTPEQINPSLTNYKQALSPIVSKALTTTLSSQTSVSATKKLFLETYNQWQIDKQENYSNVYPNWIATKNTINTFVEDAYTNYQGLEAVLNSGNTARVVAELDTLLDGTTVEHRVADIADKALEHSANIQAASAKINASNSQVSTLKTYLTNFNDSTDTFNESKVDKAISAIGEAKDTVATINGDTDNFIGTIGMPTNEFFLIMQGVEAANIISNRQAVIRSIGNQIAENQRLLVNAEAATATYRQSIIDIAASILALKSDLSAAIASQAALQGTSFLADKITHLSIERLNVTPAVKEEFFPSTTTPKNGTTYEWDLNLYKFTGETLPIFTTAGTYEISLRVYDKAGNQALQKGYITIKPDQLFVDASSNCNSAAQTNYADMVDTCRVTLPQFDRFGNRIRSNKDLKLIVRDQDVNGSYNLVTERGENYQNGIRFVGGSFVGNKHQMKWAPSGSDQKIIKIKSLLPTITVLPYLADPRYAIGYQAANGFDLPLILEHPKIGARGNVLAQPLQDDLDFKVNFKPWLNVALSDKSGPPSTDTWNISLGDPFPVFAQASTGSGTKNLPSAFSVNVTGFVDENFSFSDENLARPGETLNFTPGSKSSVESGQPSMPAEILTTIQAVSALSGQQDLRPFLIPTGAHQVLDAPRGPKTIYTPGMPIGACPDPDNCIPPIIPDPVNVYISDASAEEGQRLRFNFTLSDPAEIDMELFLSVTDVTATITDDYTFSGISVTIPRGESSVEYSLPTIDDDIVETDETFVLSIDSYEPSGAIGDYTSTGTATITDNDNTLYIYDTTATEGSICKVGVRLHHAADEDVIVELSPGDISDTAQAGTDYIATNVTGTITKGQTAIDLSIPTIDDQLEEGPESFTVNIASVSGGNLSDYAIVSDCVISDNDKQPNITIVSNSSVYEGDNAQITVHLDKADNEKIKLRLETFDFESTDGTTATKTDDYTSRIFNVTIPAGTRAVAAPSSGIKTLDDAERESDEIFGVRIIDVLDGTVGDTSNFGVVTIIDDTPPVIPSISSISQESDAEKTPEAALSFVVILDSPNASSDDIVLTLELEDVTATGGADYSNSDITVTIPIGSMSGTSSPVTIFDDSDPEEAETFKVKHKSTDQGVLSGTAGEGMGTILDNDVTPPAVFIDDSSAIEEDGLMNFTVRLSAPHVDLDGNQLKLIFKPTPLTATSGSDFMSQEYQATFSVGDSQTSLEPIILVDDAEVENAETFEVSFFRVESTHAVGDTTDTAIGTILDGDNTNPPSIIISDASGAEGNQAVFSVALDSSAHGGVTIEFESQDGAATSPADYICPAGQTTLIFGTGEMGPKTVACDIELDEVNEALEDFELVVKTVTGAIASGGDADRGTGNIQNVQYVDLVVENPGIIMENDESGLVEFTVNLYDNGQPMSDALESAVSVTLDPQDIVAAGGASFLVDGIDFRSGSINAIFNPGKGEGSTTAKVGVTINNDNSKEVNSAFTTSPENRQENFLLAPIVFSDTIRNATGTEAIIQDEDNFICDDESRVHVRDGRATEGDLMLFDIQLAESNCKGPVTLTFKTVDRNAKAGEDFTGGTYTINIPRGEKRPARGNELRIQTTQDPTVESDEDFQLVFVSATPASFVTRVERKKYREDGTLQDMGTVPIEGLILDNDDDNGSDPTPDLIIENSGAEEGFDMDFVVRLSEPSDVDTKINFQALTAGLTNPASAGNDYYTNIATLSIIAGEGEGIARIRTKDDAVIEASENLLLGYLNLAAGRLNDRSDNGSGVIFDNDQADVTPRVLISDASALEGNEVTFTIKLENPGTGTPMIAPKDGIQFEIITDNDTATKGDDFGPGRSVTIQENESQRQFKVTTVDDDLVEADENFIVRITSTNKPSEVVNITDTAIGTITDNDSPVCSNLPIADQNCCNFPTMCLTTGGQPGADIEGQIIVDQALCSGDACNDTDTETVVLGTTNVAVDIREEITRNAYELIRGQDADNLVGGSPKNDLGQNIIKRNNFVNNGNTINRWDIYVNDLPDGGVTYLDGQGNGYFRIGLRRSDGNFGTQNNPAKMSGKHTFVVINGSLNIVGDMDYASVEDSLGVIVLNSNIENLQDLSRRGQLTIFKNVRHTVGAYFTDGSFVSNVWAKAGNGGGRLSAGANANPNDDWDIVNGPQLGKQLILTGNLLSKNTLGAADLTPPVDPWGATLTGSDAFLRAQMYDLNYLRRYVPEKTAGVHTNASSCAKLPGTSDCYTNEKSFVLRIDPRLKENPPPGFEASAITKLR